MTMLETYKNITKNSIRNHQFVVTQDCVNDYNKDEISVIPAGTLVIADFAGDFGMYGLVEIDGVLFKVKIILNELNRVDFGSFDARNPGYVPVEEDPVEASLYDENY